MLTSIIIGAGLMGHHHALVGRRAGARIIGVLDEDVAAAERLAKRFPCAVAGTRLADFGALIRCDVAHVCTPLPTHVTVARQLAAAGIHALIEKPLAATAADTTALAGVFDTSATFFCPVHQYAFQQGVEDARDALSEIEPVMRIDIDIASAGGGSDRARCDRIAGEILPHPLSIIQRLRPDVALGTLDWRSMRSGPGEWQVTTCHEGALVSIGISLGSRPTRFATRIAGVRGTIEIDNFHGYAIGLSGAVSRAAKITGPFERTGKHMAKALANLASRAIRREAAYPGLRQLTQRFYAAVARGDQGSVPISPAQAIDIAVARDVIIARIENDA